MLTWKDITNLRIFKTLRFKDTADVRVERPNGTTHRSNMYAVSELGKQGAPAAKTTSTTLTAAELLGRLLTANQGASGAATYTLPLAADLEAALLAVNSNLQVDHSFEFSVINLSTVAAEDATIATNTGWTLVGSMVVESNEATAQKGPSGRFLVRRTGASAYTLYRIA